MKKTTPLIIFALSLFLSGLAIDVNADPELLYDFSHPDTPHTPLSFRPIVIEELISIENDTAELIDTTKEIPTLVVLLEFQNMDHRTDHNPNYWLDLVFGDPRAPSTHRPSVAEVVRKNSNGRFILVPALAGDVFDGSQDGVVGWVRSQHRTDAAYWTQNGLDQEDTMRGRAEGIIAADPFFDFSIYDQAKTRVDGAILAPDGVIRNDELVIVVVFADNLPDQECGDRRLDPGEQCDDGNIFNNDGCSNQCLIEVTCGNLIINGNEDCDDGNNTNGDGCSADCSTEGICGNNIIETSEECDDNNTLDRDGCSSGCLKELNCDQHVGHTNTPLPGTTGCQWTAGGNTRLAYDGDYLVDVDKNTSPVWVYQGVAGVSELAAQGVVIHELGHSVLGLGDLYGECGGTNRQNVANGYICNNNPNQWFPPEPGLYSTMASYPGSNPPSSGFVTHLSPWAKVHLGFVIPQFVTHDGSYTLSDTEGIRNITQQNTQPEALIIFDPLKGVKEYFVLENRAITGLGANPVDEGLAIWLINENETNYRHMVRLVERSGFNVPDTDTLWDGSESPPDYYDFGTNSSPRNSNWTDGTQSYIEIYDIAPASNSITFKVRMTPLFVNSSYIGAETGTEAEPFNTIQEAIEAIPESPRTIDLAPGLYPTPLVITEPLTLVVHGNGSAIISE